MTSLLALIKKVKIESVLVLPYLSHNCQAYVNYKLAASLEVLEKQTFGLPNCYCPIIKFISNQANFYMKHSLEIINITLKYS